uniref:Transposase (Putative), gypsy type n=1 Tax=Tanacetum cinerariifolium TaxID=118510 RepID=A0A6L2L8K0_TANCI|nr:hypothetical protein [Tanacetum cinerariifolium]
MDAGGVSHPPKKLRGDHGTPSGASIGASASATLEREDGHHTKSVAEPNLRTIRAPSSILIMTAVTTITLTVDPTLVTKEKFVAPYPFGAGSSTAGETDPIAGVFSDLIGSDFSFFASVCKMEHDQLFTEFNVETALQMSLSAEGKLLKSREEEIKSLKAWLLLREAEAAKAIRLHAEASSFETVTELETSVESKERTEGTSNVVSATRGATTTLSTTFDSASIIAPIFVDDYEVIDAEDQAVTDRNAASFPNIDDAELNIVQRPVIHIIVRATLLRAVGEVWATWPLRGLSHSDRFDCLVPLLDDIRRVLTQKARDAFYAKFYIPGEMHPFLPNQNDTMHERPSGKIRLYTTFFDCANFRLPLSTFLVDVLRPFRINISPLCDWGSQGGVSHPPKKLRGDHGTLSGASIASVYATLEREDGHHTKSVAEPNLCTIRAPSSILIMTVVITITLTVDPTLVTKEKFVAPYPFGAGSYFAGETDPIAGVFSDLIGSDFSYALQMSLSAEVRMRAEYNVKEKRRLKEAEAAEAIRLHAEASNFETVTELETLVESKECELTDLNALIHKLEMSSGELQEKVTVYENFIEQLERFQDDRMKVVNHKFDKLYTEFVEMALHLEEKFYPHLLTTISGRRWLLTQGIKLAIIKCLNSPEYLSALGATISKAIKKEVDYISALQQLQNVNFLLLAELKSNKDASIEVVIKILRLKEPLADKSVLDELQPNKIKENIANQRSALHDVFVPLSEPLPAVVLIGTEGTSNVVSATGGATTTLSTTFAFANIIAPIFVDDYEAIDAEDQAVTDGNAASFPNIDDAELNIV